MSDGEISFQRCDDRFTVGRETAPPIGDIYFFSPTGTVAFFLLIVENPVDHLIFAEWWQSHHVTPSLFPRHGDLCA